MPHFGDLYFLLSPISSIPIWWIDITRYRYQWENNFYHHDFLQLCLVYFPGLPCQYRCQMVPLNIIKWYHFCFQWLLVVYVPTNCFDMADQSFYTNTSGCTDLVYHVELVLLLVLARDSKTQGGQWSRCVYHILCILGPHPFLICLLENFLLVGSNPVSLWWNPQCQISDLMNLATDRSVKNLDQVH